MLYFTSLELPSPACIDDTPAVTCYNCYRHSDPIEATIDCTNGTSIGQYEARQCTPDE